MMTTTTTTRRAIDTGRGTWAVIDGRDRFAPRRTDKQQARRLAWDLIDYFTSLRLTEEREALIDGLSRFAMSGGGR